jgi:hypothetical protein
MRRRLFRVLVVGSALGVAAAQLRLLAAGQLVAYRLVALALAVAIGVSAGSGALVPRLGCALVGSALLGLSVLELLLLRGPVLALGVLALGAGASTLLAVAWGLAVERTSPAAARGLQNLAVATAALLVALAAAEGVLGLVLPASVYEVVPDHAGGPGILAPAQGAGWRLRPGFRGRYLHPEFYGLRVEVNRLGFRDGLDEGPPAPGDASVLILGDSLAFGTGVALDETFHRLLEARGTELSARPLRVYGAGVPGFGQLDELEFLGELAPVLHPDVVVVALYEGNDLADNLHGEQPGPRRGSPPPASDTAMVPPSPLPGFLRAVQRLGFWVGSSALVQYALPLVESHLRRLGVRALDVPSNAMLDACLLRTPPTDVEEALARTVAALEALREQARPAELIVLLVPAAIQAEPARYAEFLAAHPRAARDAYARTDFHTRLAARIRALGIVTVDPLPALEATALAGHPGYHREGHWNAVGHRIGADLLAPVLAERLRARETARGPEP